MPQPGTHEYKHSSKLYNSGEYKSRTNCYAYAFDLINNPITGEVFYSRNELIFSDKPYAAQPGMFSGYYSSSDDTIYDGTEESNKRLVEYVKADSDRLGLDFKEYEEGMEGGYAVLLVIEPGSDYHWYRQDIDGTWSHKLGDSKVITGVEDPVIDALSKNYTTIVGYYYITEVCDVQN